MVAALGWAESVRGSFVAEADRELPLARVVDSTGLARADRPVRCFESPSKLPVAGIRLVGAAQCFAVSATPKSTFLRSVVADVE